MIRIIDTEDYSNVISGIATSIWFQGCSARCEGCHNPELLDFSTECTLTIADAKKSIDAFADRNETVSFLGGEPLEADEFIELLLYAKAKGLTTILWTGRTKVPKIVLENLDYIKVGRYVKKKHGNFKYYGSSNQRFYQIINKKELKEVD